MLRESRHGELRQFWMARTALGRPLHSVNAFLLDGLLVDTGCPATARELQRHLAPYPVERIVLTHHHEDHIGGAALLQRELKVPVLAPAALLPLLGGPLRIPIYRRVVWGRPQRFVAAPLPPLLHHRERSYTVVSTPGQAFEHVALFDRERRWLFSGDLYLHERVTHLRRAEDFWTHLDSLRTVLELEPEVLICSHAGVIPDAVGALRRKIAFWEELSERVRELQTEGRPPREIRDRLLGRESFLSLASLGDFSKLNMVRALLDPDR